jgi:molybdopterin-containing oxidoreductase family molybdopterin binding subunit
MGVIEEERARYREIFGERDKQKDYWTYSVCGLCYCVCAIRVKVVDGKPVAIEGVPESDKGAQGGLCAKGVTGLMHYYDPNRILYPLKRTNPKKGLHEDPKWQRISWDEALDTVAEKLGEAHKNNPRGIFGAIAPAPTGWSDMPHARLLMTLGGGGFAVGGPGRMCGASVHHLGALDYAAWDEIPDYRYCNYVLRCGGNEGWGSGRQGAATIRLAAAARERGMKMKVIDPQGFTIASKAQEWIPILPATDLAVLLAIANLIVNEIGVYDKEYIRHKTNGSYLIGPDLLYVRDEQTNKPLLYDEADGKVKTYDDPTLARPAIDAGVEGKYVAQGVECQPAFALIKKHLEQYKPEWASEISTVPADTIRQLAKELVEEAKIGSFIEIEGAKVPYRPACVIGYKGMQTHNNGHHTYTTMHLINVLLGNQDVCGGLLGSGGIQSFGYPETGRFRFGPFVGEEGMLSLGAWRGMAQTWPIRKIEGPGTKASFGDILVHGGGLSSQAEDWEELWDNAGRPYEPAVFFPYGGNPAMNHVRPEAAEKFLSKVPFAVALQPFHNETTEGFCDIVLPETHYLEMLDLGFIWGVINDFPIGMDKWSVHPRLPVTEPKGETRWCQDVMNDLADRLGVRSEYNDSLDGTLAFRMTPENAETPRIIESEDRISAIELADRLLQYHFGKEKGLEWFRDNGFITWEKKPEEAYWRWSVDARIPAYYEGLERDREEIKKRGEQIGLHLDWNQYTPLTTYFPSVIHTELPPDSEYDLFLISQRDSLMSQRFSARNPQINAMAATNPYSFNITMNEETAKKEGIKDGDTIWLENHWGDKVTGTVKLSRLIHPQVVAAVGLGSWAKAAPIAQGKGINPNALHREDQHHFDPVSGASEPTVRVKVYKK